MKLAEVTFVDVEEVEAAHPYVLEKHGGQAGSRDKGLLASAVMAPQTGYYASLAELAAVYAHGIGTAIAFLKTNGFPQIEIGEEWIRHIERLAAGDLSRDELVTLFVELMGGDPVVFEG